MARRLIRSHPGTTRGIDSPSFLLIGPYDPHCGEYTFLAPPLGVWRMAGVLEAAGYRAEVFDPNICDRPPEVELAEILAAEEWNVVGVSTTGMTLRFDLALAHQARRALPYSILVSGGMEATFKPDLMFELGPFDVVVLGEGERPLVEMAERLRAGSGFEGMSGTAELASDGTIVRHYQTALSQAELVEAIAKTPYERMPYPAYWQRLENAYRVGGLPFKADREARLAEIRSVRLITLNYCPMNCTFCSSTNFLHAAQGSIAKVGRLDAEECMTMLRRIVAAQPEVKTVIFQDDIFVFTSDQRILPLCEAIVAAKRDGSLPADLQFISTNRIDAMNRERLQAMRSAGFRVLGFGIENFSDDVLREFNKTRIIPYVRPNLTLALEVGITPFLDLILTSPGASIHDLSETVRQGYEWTMAGCEVGMYPYVIPFSGAAMANDPKLEPHTVYQHYQVADTEVSWRQPVKILPADPQLRAAILAIEEEFERRLKQFQGVATHMPSRQRSLLWVASAIPILAAAGESMPPRGEVVDELLQRLPGLDAGARQAHRESFALRSEFTRVDPPDAPSLGAAAR